MLAALCEGTVLPYSVGRKQEADTTWLPTSAVATSIPNALEVT